MSLPVASGVAVLGLLRARRLYPQKRDRRLLGQLPKPDGRRIVK